ncbi:hypothetical protein AZI86_11800 [Bdellovibrio bacteriovorus]|uniref:HNH nuclease domain-containing protein n=1 Tax=Bdellovibrio bacteriovorus TaxID=959 RepID=A0A150WM57_BDEBC|nr:HNH endonuclease signature motif containing protein [Bdellovibrio bacteriovorus]KYG64877.1 hypothetical protein AZI86_11800 [Bdellovibrio bacteriovorus]
MDLQNFSNSEIVHRMQKLVKTERKITHLVLVHILEIEARRIYAELGYDGMYTYLTRELGYSEAAAYRRLQSARLLKQMPELSEKIESGALHLSQLTRVQKCLKEKSQKGAMISCAQVLTILEKVENKNTFQTEAVLAKEFDLPIPSYEVLRPQSDESVRLEITLTAEQFKELQKAKDLLSHVCPHGEWSEVIGALARKFNDKNILKSNAPRATLNSKKLSSEGIFVENVNEDVSANENGNRNSLGTKELVTDRVIATKVSPRKAISVAVKKELFRKANACCEYVNKKNRQRCGSKYQLQIDHVKPVAFGGTSDLTNLRILCRTHNLLAAEKAGLSDKRARG